jgi:imidazolonepropionase-like amidohydrolase
MRAAIAALAIAGCAQRGPGLAPASLPPVEDVAIVGVTVVHPGPALEEPDQTVVLSGGSIAAVGPRATTLVPETARVIDGRGRWLSPGLIDAHVHFFQSGDPFTRPDAADFNDVLPYAIEDARNRTRLPETFEVYLASGLTSVIDDGGPMWNFEVRDRARVTAAAPRVQVAGPLISLVDDPPLDLGDPPIVKCTTPAQATALAERELARHPDFVKVWFIHDAKKPMGPDQAIVRAAADAAHKGHTRLMVHATELDAAKAAVDAGADILVHSVFEKPIDDDFVATLLDHHVILIPTLWVRDGYKQVLGRTFVPTEEERRLGDPDVVSIMSAVPRITKRRPFTDDAALANLAQLEAAGVPIALGTDAGNIGTLPGPSIFREARMMAKAGLTPAQVLRAATVGGAAVLGMSDRLGDVTPGRLADLVVFAGDPLASVDNLSSARYVIRAGRVYEPDQLLADVRAH